MAISIFDLFKIGIGPSSSHTVGPMKAALMFVSALADAGLMHRTQRVTAELFGSLGATGAGHGSPKAVILGLLGEAPDTVDVATIADRVSSVRENSTLSLLGSHPIAFSYRDDLVMHRSQSLPFHPNGMRFSAYERGRTEASDPPPLLQKVFYSVGGGFIVDESAATGDVLIDDPIQQPFPFASAKELLVSCKQSGQCISSLILANELVWRPLQDIKDKLDQLWTVMQASISKGCQTEGIMPGGLKVKRRAAHLYTQLTNDSAISNADPLRTLDWVTLYALAVNEENASGGRIVTAPTNGAAGIIPAVLRYYLDFDQGDHNRCSKADQLTDIHRFLLTAGAIGILYKTNASISDADVGCQGEVGSACSMAAGALAEVMGATPEQVENAAEIAMEHNLGLTCDPVGGLVQVPCIERNAMAAIKAISAARMALRGNGEHYVSLDQVIKTMRDTGRDMQDKYKETARGGLAVNVLDVPVSVIEC